MMEKFFILITSALYIYILYRIMMEMLRVTSLLKALGL